MPQKIRCSGSWIYIYVLVHCLKFSGAAKASSKNCLLSMDVAMISMSFSLKRIVGVTKRKKLKLDMPVLFSLYFCLLIQAKQLQQQRNVHLVSGAGIRTHDLLEMSLPLQPLDQEKYCCTVISQANSFPNEPSSMRCFNSVYV